MIWPAGVALLASLPPRELLGVIKLRMVREKGREDEY